MSFEMNKAFLAILIAVLFFILTNMFTGSVFEEHALVKNSYPIAVASTDGPAVGVEVKKGPSLAMLMASADIDAGKKGFKPCKACHTTVKGGKAGTGPNLWNVVGRTKASVEGFAYSKAMIGKGGDWVYTDLDTFLTKPGKFVKKTKMVFAGIKKAKKRANVIAYLRSLSDAPIALPVEEAPAEEAAAVPVEAPAEH